jgi:hypothetical protein
MKKSILLNLLILPAIIFGQSVKKIKNKLDQNSVEIFYVLKSDNLIKQGSYKLIRNKIIIEKGNYVNNFKDGEWKIFHNNGTKSAEGNFKNGKRIKIWEFYNNRNELIQTYDFENNILTNEGSLKDEKIETGNGKFKGLLFTDSEPTFANGSAGIGEFIKNNFNYSGIRKETETKGKIYVSATLLANGELIELKILRGINEILDKEAIRVVKLMEGKWNPAEFEGEKLTKKIVIPITIE